MLQNEPLDETRPPKKAHTRTKTRSKPPREKIMVKREVSENGSEVDDDWESREILKTAKVSFPDSELLVADEMRRLRNWDDRNDIRDEVLEDEEDEDEEDADDADEEDERREEAAAMPLVRRRRSTRSYDAYLGPSPLSVSYASNYDPALNKDWVKPRYSSIVYRSPVSIKRIIDLQSIFFVRNSC